MRDKRTRRKRQGGAGSGASVTIPANTLIAGRRYRLGAGGVSEISDKRAPLSREQRRRIIAGKLAPGDVAALRAHVGLTQSELATALGISVGTLRNWEQDRTTPVGSGLALLRIAARHPHIIRESISRAA
jgi:DNA-binding transcriptional regulator YiaG